MKTGFLVLGGVILFERMTVNLDVHDMRALQVLAAGEFRDFRLQAVLIIHQELERRGLLPNSIQAEDRAKGSDYGQPQAV